MTRYIAHKIKVKDDLLVGPYNAVIVDTADGMSYAAHLYRRLEERFAVCYAYPLTFCGMMTDVYDYEIIADGEIIHPVQSIPDSKLEL